MHGCLTCRKQRLFSPSVPGRQCHYQITRRISIAFEGRFVQTVQCTSQILSPFKLLSVLRQTPHHMCICRTPQNIYILNFVGLTTHLLVKLILPATDIHRFEIIFFPRVGFRTASKWRCATICAAHCVVPVCMIAHEKFPCNCIKDGH